MGLRQLRYFIHVADLKSFSRAALAVHIAQPALSRQIHNLEDEVGTRLFYRDGRGATLTDAGERYYQRVKAILRQLEEAKTELQEAGDTPSGTVVLGLPPQLGALFPARVIQLFRMRYPAARIRIAEGFSFQIAEWLQTGKVELGFVYDPKCYRHLHTELLLDEALYLVGPAGLIGDLVADGDGTFPFNRIVGLPLIVPDLPSTLRSRIEALAAAAGVVPRFAIEIDSLPAIKQLAIDGEGCTILPFSAVHDEVKRGQLAAALIVEPSLSRPLGLVVPQKGCQSVASRKLILLIQEEVRRLVRSGNWSGRIVERAATRLAG